MHCEVDHIHPGQTQTIDIIRQLFWWPGMKQDVINYVDTCDVCQRSKYSNKTPGKMVPMGVPSGKWRTVCMDFLDMPNVMGFNKILIVVDKFSKMVKLLPLKERETTTEQIIEQLSEKVFLNFSMPDDIISDRDVRFTSDAWGKYYDVHKIKLRMSSTNHQQTNGQSERMGKIVREKFRILGERDWVSKLGKVEFAINAAKSQTTGRSPFEIVLGFTPQVEEKMREDVTKILKRLETVPDKEILDEVKEKSEKAQEVQKKHYDKHRVDVQYKVGEKVLVRSEYLRGNVVGEKKKLSKLWSGPWEVVKVVNQNLYKIKLPAAFKVHNEINIENLKEYKDRGDRNPGSEPVTDIDEHEFEVEKIIGDRRAPGRGNKKQYLVRWQGWGEEYDEWVHEGYLINAKEAITIYWAEKEKLAKTNYNNVVNVCSSADSGDWSHVFTMFANVGEDDYEEKETALLGTLKLMKKESKKSKSMDDKCDECGISREKGKKCSNWDDHKKKLITQIQLNKDWKESWVRSKEVYRKLGERIKDLKPKWTLRMIYSMVKGLTKDKKLWKGSVAFLGEGSNANQIKQNTTPSTCYRCGEKGHTTPECKMSGEVLCKSCGRKGHVIKACKAAGKQPAKENNNSDRELLCFKCGKKDHTAMKCAVKEVQCSKCNLRGHCTTACEKATAYRKQKGTTDMVCRNCNKKGHAGWECPTGKSNSVLRWNVISVVRRDIR